MPTYVYECRKCDKQFEVEQRITESALTDCECGEAGSLRRVIQPIAVMFKGAGFHINDYAGRSAPAEATATPTTDAAACSGEPASCARCAPEATSE
ncbi:MAG: FmdB family zinc ribbon protein [Fimbriimonadaceae bacterium]|nr:FmdB family zinc ribbon protein [Fimbriimonadaceae bacterium]